MPLQQLALLLIATPGAIFLALSLVWLLGGGISERAMSRITHGVSAILIVIIALISWGMWQSGLHVVRASLGVHWFKVAHYEFPLAILLDRLSLPMVAITVILAAAVGAFSVRYLHRDPGFFRFFLLLHLFTFGALLVFMGDSLDVLVAGWELVGITSVLLIGFFQYRPDPVRNALRVFAIYRVADLFLLMAVFFAHHWLKTASWEGLFSGAEAGHAHSLSASQVSLIAVLLVFAASGKSAQGPFCGWLARAMEGPTPSSAIFYGAISTCAGTYLLLRVAPLLQGSAIATGLVIFIGVTTALLSTLVHRTCADVKTSLAYATQTQLGLIFVEIGLGWLTFAIIHLISHSVLRTLQFLRSPSMLHDDHRVHAAAGGRRNLAEQQHASLLPQRARLWLYATALIRGFYDAIVDRFITAPVVRIAQFLRVFELR